MKVLLAELAPRRADVAGNLASVEAAVSASRPDLAVFPELFLTGYSLGDRLHSIALREDDGAIDRLKALAGSTGATVVVGAPVRSPERSGEIWNAALVARPGAPVEVRGKRFLPTFGPFEEGARFSGAGSSPLIPLRGGRLGTAICYDAFFPEVSRDLAIDGADLIAILSAAPVTSRKLFDKVLPARAIENALPVVYVNRVGVEDGLVFGGGSIALDARGEAVPTEAVAGAATAEGERLLTAEVDTDEARHWRPFRPVLRDRSARAAASVDGAGRSGSAP